jgi:hypothetical protein
MKAFKTYFTIDESKNVTLSNLPFKTGQKIEAVLIEAEDKKNIIDSFKTLFKKTQSLPHVKRISEQDIRNEIKAYRASV